MFYMFHLLKSVWQKQHSTKLVQELSKGNSCYTSLENNNKKPRLSFTVCSFDLLYFDEKSYFPQDIIGIISINQTLVCTLRRHTFLSYSNLKLFIQSTVNPQQSTLDRIPSLLQIKWFWTHTHTQIQFFFKFYEHFHWYNSIQANISLHTSSLFSLLHHFDLNSFLPPCHKCNLIY